MSTKKSSLIVESKTTTRSFGKHARIDTTTFADGSRRYRVYLPNVVPGGIQTESLKMAEELAGLRVEDLKAVIKGEKDYQPKGNKRTAKPEPDLMERFINWISS